MTVDEAQQVHIRVTATPEDGKANAAVRKLLARAMGIAPSRLTLVGGARIDPYRQKIVNNNTGGVGRNIDEPVNFRIGARNRLTDAIAVHANWGENFSLNTGTDRNDNGFGPETGRGYEVGIAAKLPGIDMAATWFDIRKQDILTTDPVDP